MHDQSYNEFYEHDKKDHIQYHFPDLFADPLRRAFCLCLLLKDRIEVFFYETVYCRLHRAYLKFSDLPCCL